jgi:hypothetical protein
VIGHDICYSGGIYKLLSTSTSLNKINLALLLPEWVKIA